MGYYSPYNKPRQLRVWVAGCPHVEPDKNNGRDSIADSIAEVEGIQGFNPDLGFIIGDFASNQGSTELTEPTDITHGEECASQLQSGSRLTRNKIYTCKGNHDAGVDNYDWYDRYIDLLGENTAYSGVDNSQRPYPINGTADRYSIQTGNVLWLVMSDINDGDNPCGMGDTPNGGYPSGSVTEEMYDWWENMVANNQDKNIITLHHHNLKDTIIATGDNEGVNGGYHGSTGQPIGSGRLHNIITNKALNTYEEDQTRFQTYLSNNNGCISAWLSSHTHYNRGETYNSRGWHHNANGVHHIGIGGLTRFHGTPKDPQSIAIVLENGSTSMKVYKIHHGKYFSIGMDYEYIIDITLNHAFNL